MTRLGRVTSTFPLKVQLNSDTTDAPAETSAGMPALTVDQEVLVISSESRRLIVWAGAV